MTFEISLRSYAKTGWRFVFDIGNIRGVSLLVLKTSNIQWSLWAFNKRITYGSTK